MNWVLLIVIVSGNGGSVTSQLIQSFTSQAKCEAAMRQVGLPASSDGTRPAVYARCIQQA